MIDIRDIARMNEFDLEFKSLGTVHCLVLRSDLISQANKLSSTVTEHREVVRWLFGEMAVRNIENSANTTDNSEGVGFTPEEINLVSESELEEFADKLVQEYKYLLKTYQGNSIVRTENESACNFFIRAIVHYAVEQKVSREKLIKSANGAIFSKATMDAIQLNSKLSDQLKNSFSEYSQAQAYITAKDKLDRMDMVSKALSSIEKEEAMRREMTRFANPQHELPNYQQPDLQIPFIPENPIHETNKKLAQAASLISSMNDTALRMQEDYIVNSQTTEKQTSVAIKIGAGSLVVSAIGLVISAIFSYQSYVDAKKSDENTEKQIKAFQSEIRNLRADQREERAAIVKAIEGTRSAPASIVKK
ncbi:MAG: hypothetical protein PHY62_02365 [Gallionella sp.]|nr:hypothetical protein [Gallionella sp.]